MRKKLFSAAALAVALAGFGPRVAEAEIIWSGSKNITATSATSPKFFGGGGWKWGVEQGGSDHYAYLTPQDRPFVPYTLTKSLNHLKVENLAVGTIIDGATSGFWNSYPTNEGTQDNLELWDFANNMGSFPVGTDGYSATKVADGAGGFTFGWVEFRVNIDGTVTYIQGAYQNISGVGIAVGAVPEIDPAGIGRALALVLGAGGMIERRRRQATASV